VEKTVGGRIQNFKPWPKGVSGNAVRHGRGKKRKNAVAAMLCGALPAGLLGFHSASPTWKLCLLGLIVGLIWGNAFEYIYHRWLLHRPRSPLGAGHHDHHAQIGTPEEAEYVAFISSPRNIVLLFVINGVPAFLISTLIGLRGILPGVFIGWMLYLIAAEEIHWRIHMNGWLPPGLQFARDYHMSHHDIPNSRFNVFLPLVDLLFGTSKSKKQRIKPESLAQIPR
jgi:hypothetical protein